MATINGDDVVQCSGDDVTACNITGLVEVCSGKLYLLVFSTVVQVLHSLYVCIDLMYDSVESIDVSFPLAESVQLDVLRQTPATFPCALTQHPILAYNHLNAPLRHQHLRQVRQKTRGRKRTAVAACFTNRRGFVSYFQLWLCAVASLVS